MVPGVGQHVDLVGACERADGAIAARFVVLAPADSAVKLEADLVAARRIVVLRNVDRVIVLEIVLGVILQHDHAGFLRRVGAAGAQEPEGVVKRGAALGDVSGVPRGFRWRARRQKFLEGSGDRRGGRLRAGIIAVRPQRRHKEERGHES